MRIGEHLKRFFVAWSAAALAAGICLYRGHVDLDPAHPASMLNVFRHKCGILMVLCVCWLWFEAFRMVLSPAGFRNTVR